MYIILIINIIRLFASPGFFTLQTWQSESHQLSGLSAWGQDRQGQHLHLHFGASVSSVEPMGKNPEISRSTGPPGKASTLPCPWYMEAFSPNRSVLRNAEWPNGLKNFWQRLNAVCQNVQSSWGLGHQLLRIPCGRLDFMHDNASTIARFVLEHFKLESLGIRRMMHGDHSWSMVILHERSVESTTKWNVAAGRGFRGPFRHWAAETAENILGEFSSRQKFTLVIHKQHVCNWEGNHMKSPKSSQVIALSLHENQKPNGCIPMELCRPFSMPLT